MLVLDSDMTSVGSAQWRRSEDVLWRSLAGVAVLRSLETSEFVTLQSTANLVWLGLEFPGTEIEIAADIEEVVGEPCGPEVAEALGQLVDLGFVVSA